MLDVKRTTWARRPARIALLVILGSAFTAGSVLSAPAPATLRAKVTGWEKLIPHVYAEASKSDAHRYTWREPSPTVKQDFRKLSGNVTKDVCIAAFASGTAPAHEPLSIKVTGGRTAYSTIALSPGSRLSFKNADPFPHALYEVGNAQWAPNSLAPGSTREWAAGPVGVHEIRDQLIPSVVMYIVVDPGVVEFAFPDHEGAFSMPLAPGEYTLKAFFDGKPVAKESVVMHFGVVEMREPLVLGGGDSK